MRLANKRLSAKVSVSLNLFFCITQACLYSFSTMFVLHVILMAFETGLAILAFTLRSSLTIVSLICLAITSMGKIL